MREIKFRAWDNEIGGFIYSDWKYGVPSFWDNIHNDYTKRYGPVEQFTGLKDKNNTDIYEGDRLKIKWVQQNYQTHTGDNIPFGGSYTEPDTSTIEEILDGGYVVVFENGSFRVGGEYGPPKYCYEDTLETFLSSHWWEDVFDGMEDNYFEDEGYSTLAELKASCGVEIIGNIHQNPELLNPE